MSGSLNKQTFSADTTVFQFIKSAIAGESLKKTPSPTYGRRHNGMAEEPSKRAALFELAEALLEGDPIAMHLRTGGGVVRDDSLEGRYHEEISILEMEGGTSYYHQCDSVAILEDAPDQIKALCAVADIDETKVRAILESGTASHYRSFTIPKKSGGRRQIEAPDEDLMLIQRKLLDNIIYKFGPSSAAHGFVCGRSLATNAMHHIGMKKVLKLDLKDFFTTCTSPMVKGALWPLMKNEFRNILTPLVALVTKDGVLPQGAPTSPALANLCFAYADFFLTGLAGRTECTYTRYADDLVFSSDTFEVKKIIPVVDKILRKFGFVRNKKKTDVLKQSQRQKVTGVVVNVKMSVPRRTRRNFKACLHNILAGKQPCDEGRLAKLKGKMAFFKMVSSEQAEKFMENMRRIEDMVKGQAHLPIQTAAASKPKKARRVVTKRKTRGA